MHERAQKAVSTVHSFLFACFVPLQLFAQNRQEAAVGEVVAPLAIVLAANALIQMALWLCRLNVSRANMVVSALWLAFFLFMPAVQLSNWRIRYVIVVFLLLGAGVIAVAWRASARSMMRATQAMTMFAVLLTLNPARVLAVEAIGDSRRALAVVPQSVTPPDTLPLRPDIYYVILDGYASGSSLHTFFGHDNSSFEKYLESKGFYIASQSRSNYASTINSVASSLNMEHAPAWNDTDPVRVRRRIHNSRVFQEVRRRGYEVTFLTMSSHLRPDRATPLIDHHVAFGGISGLPQYQMTLLGLTPVRLALTYAEQTPLRGLAGRIDRDGKLWRPEGIDWVLARMTEPRRRPSFVFVHVLSPHSPYYHDAACTVNPAYADGSWNNFDRGFGEYREAYVAQVQCLNRKVTRALDALIDSEGARDRIVILQADHGAPEILDGPLLRQDRDIDLAEFRFSILNAYRVPDGIRDRLYPAITPVNTFRLVLGNLFAIDLPQQPDISYWLRDGAFVQVPRVP